MNDSFLTNAQIEELDMLCRIILKSDECNFSEKKINLDILFREFCRLYNFTRTYIFKPDWFVENVYITVKFYNKDNVLHVYYYDIAKQIRVQKIKSIYE